MKKIIEKAISGSVIGICIGFMIPFFISLINGYSEYMPVTPALVSVMGNEMNALMIQIIVSIMLGISFSCSTSVYDMENISLLKQTIMYFVINGISMMIAGYDSKWINIDVFSFAIFFAEYAVIFCIVWIIIYIKYIISIKSINDKINMG